MTNEIWKPLAHPLHCLTYEVSNLGRVRRAVDGKGKAHGAKAGHILKLRPKSGGHLRVSFRETGKRHAVDYFVHRLVLEAFVGPAPAGMECCHNDNDPANNRLGNLRWDTRSANILDRPNRAAPRHKIRGERHHKAKLSTADVLAIRSAPRSYGSLPTLAKRFGVSESTISSIRAGSTWKTPETLAQ